MTKRPRKKPAGDPALKTWPRLNEAMRDADVKTCRRLMAKELKGRRRKRFLMRLQGRLNRLQGAAALEKVAAKAKEK